MQYFFRIFITATLIALLTNCASTGEDIEAGNDTIATQPGAVESSASPDYQTYPYGQAPSGYDVYDTGVGNKNISGSPDDGAYSQEESMVRNTTISADRIIYFDYDSFNIRTESRPVIESNARALAKNRLNITQLEGHTDERGSREYNIALGERRANSVRQYMLGLGVAPQQIRVVSYGEERPTATGQDEQSYALNRRVEIVY
jgi:peptidoglycan-associated lipoprotein